MPESFLSTSQVGISVRFCVIQYFGDGGMREKSFQRPTSLVQVQHCGPLLCKPSSSHPSIDASAAGRMTLIIADYRVM